MKKWAGTVWASPLQKEETVRMENILEIRGLTKTYPGVVALNNLSLSVRRGECHAIVGENGAGKSTLIKSVAGCDYTGQRNHYI